MALKDISLKIEHVNTMLLTVVLAITGYIANRIDNMENRIYEHENRITRLTSDVDLLYYINEREKPNNDSDKQPLRHRGEAVLPDDSTIIHP